MSNPNTQGRRENAAQPLGDRDGTDAQQRAEKAAERERHSAGPDGPDAREVGDTFKKQP